MNFDVSGNVPLRLAMGLHLCKRPVIAFYWTSKAALSQHHDRSIQGKSRVQPAICGFRFTLTSGRS